MKIIIAAVFTFAPLLATSAYAEPTAPAPAPEAVKFKTKTVIDFSEVRLHGELVKPSAVLVTARRNASFRHLIRVRDSFVPELERSLDAL